jgi:hypothetical protein
VSSTRSGNWSDPGTWNTRAVPRATDAVTVTSGHTVTFDLGTARVSGAHVEPNAVMAFDAARTASLESSANVVVRGRLAMKPDGAAATHVLRFVDVDEATFTGGGMDPVDTDVGLWVMGAGQLDLAGSAKTGWTRVGTSLPAGAKSASLLPAPDGWRAGDEITIAPTEAPSAGAPSWSGFDEAKLVSAEGAGMTFDRATSRAHPKVNGKWTAEVANLTRNVRIEGTAGHRSHVFIRSSKPQTIKHTAIRYMGPRKDTSGDGNTDPVQGRYALHFHHSHDGSRGSMVEGTVIRDIGNNGYVPHKSHGITFRSNVGYSINGNGLWWDPPQASDDLNTLFPENSHDIVVEGNLIGKLSPIPVWDGGGGFPTAFAAASGERNIMRGNVAVGVAGEVNSNGFAWAHEGRAIWIFEDNISHNNKLHGAWIWNVSNWVHPVSRFTAYHNGDFGVFMGSYGWNYHWRDSVLYGNAGGQLIAWAAGGGAKFRVDNVVMDAAGLSDYAMVLPGRTIGGQSGVVTRSTFAGYRRAGVKLTHDFHDFGPHPTYWLLQNNTWSDAGKTNDFYVGPDDRSEHFTVHPKAVMTVSDARHGHIELRRSDQDGVYNSAWNARVTERGRAPADASYPTVSVTAPKDGAKVDDKVTITASASDNVAVERVEFYINGQRETDNPDGPKIPVDTEPPYTVTWDIRHPYGPYAPDVEPGVHTLTVLAYDSAGNSESHTTLVSNNPELRDADPSPRPSPPPTSPPVSSPSPSPPSPVPDPHGTSPPPTSELVFTPVADATIARDAPTTDYGNQIALTVDRDPMREVLLRFQLDLGGRHVSSATLRLWCIDGSSAGVRISAGAPWDEGVTWGTAPIVDLDPAVAGQWLETDVTRLVTRDGGLDLHAYTSSSDGAVYSSREADAARRPQLILVLH